MDKEESKLIIYTMATLSIVLPIGLTLCYDRVDYGSLALVSILASMVILRFDSIKNFSILGLLKAELESKIREANATLEQLREVALATSEASITDLMAGNFISSMQFSVRERLHRQIIKALKSIDVSQDALDRVNSEWKKGVSLTFHRSICNDIENNNRELREIVLGMMNFSTWSAPSPDEIQKVIEEHEYSSPEADSLLEDYRHFLDTGEIRNPERFDTKKK